MNKMYDQAFGTRVPVPGEKPDELVAAKLNEKRKADIARQEELDAAQHKAKIAKLEKETAVAENVTEKTEQPASQSSGVKISGEINYGNINYQQMMEQQIADRDRLRQAAEEQAKTQAGITESLRERLHAAELAALDTGFKMQMQVLTQMIEGYASKGNFMEQYNATRELAGQMGLVAPGGASSDMQTQLALKKMEFEQTMEMKRYAREEKRADRDFQRQLKKDDIDTEVRREDSKRQARRDEMFNSAPEIIGRVITQGYMDKGKDQGSQEVAVQNGARVHSVDADSGESGEVKCPDCGRSIGIGGTATVAVCANPDCGSRINVHRRGEPAPALVGSLGEEEEE